MKLFINGALVLLAASSFDSCENVWPRRQDRAQAETPPALDYCATDPPSGCAAVCLPPGHGAGARDGSARGARLTPHCNDLSAGELTKQFIADAQTLIVCDTEAMGDDAPIVFPTYFGITPSVLDTGVACVAPPLPPGSLPLKVIMGR